MTLHFSRKQDNIIERTHLAKNNFLVTKGLGLNNPEPTISATKCLIKYARSNLAH